MKSLILYTTGTFEPKIAKPNYQKITFQGKPVYIRLEIFDGDVANALDSARRLPGEIVLNTIAFDV